MFGGVVGVFYFFCFGFSLVLFVLCVGGIYEVLCGLLGFFEWVLDFVLSAMYGVDLFSCFGFLYVDDLWVGGVVWFYDH